MNEQNKEQKQEAGGCGPGCSCGTSGSGGRGRWIIGIVVLLIAGVLVARAVVKNNGGSSTPASTGFATLPTAKHPTAPDIAATLSDTNAATDAPKEIARLTELNAVAADTFAVFVFLPGKGETATNAPIAQMRGAARTIEPQLNGGKIGIFTLKTDSADYRQIAKQMAVPGVLAMVKGGGMSAASGDITETKLIQALAAASRAGGCGPSSGGCGPSGCN